jgi:hypothetical protein
MWGDESTYSEDPSLWGSLADRDVSSESDHGGFSAPRDPDPMTPRQWDGWYAHKIRGELLAASRYDGWVQHTIDSYTDQSTSTTTPPISPSRWMSSFGYVQAATAAPCVQVEWVTGSVTDSSDDERAGGAGHG